jgi:hypothetical protein
VVMPDAVTSLAVVVACTVLAPAWLGFGCIRLFGVDRSCGLRAAWAYGYFVGHLLLAPLMFLWLVAGQPFPGWLLPVAAAITGTLLFRRSRTRTAPATHGAGRRHSLRLLACIVLPLLVVLVPLIDLFSRIAVQPIMYGDESFIWAAKAKVWFSLSGENFGLLLRSYVSHPDYPMWNPLVHCLAFASVGDVLHWENRLPFQGFSVALLLLLSSALTRRSHPMIAAVVLLAFSGTIFAENACASGADVMLAFATLACVDCLLRAKETGDALWWRLACLALAGMLASKNEGVLLAFAVMTAFGLQAGLKLLRSMPPKRLVGHALWLLLPAGVWLGHFKLNSAFGLHNDLMMTTDGRGLLARIQHQFADYAPKVWDFFYDYCIDVARSRWLLPATAVAAIVVFVCDWRRARSNNALVLIAITWATVFVYALVFIGSNAASIDWHLGTAFDRILMQTLPVATLGLAMLIWPNPTPVQAPDEASEGAA